MKIAIVGSGISGLVCAYLLKDTHEITVFESSHKAGGHVNTVNTYGVNGEHRVDTGFIVFNQENYPGFCLLLDKLNVSSKNSRMGFSVSDPEEGVEYSGESLRGMFGSLRNVTSLKHLKMVSDIVKFHKIAESSDVRGGETVSEFLSRHNLGGRFCSHYLYPLGSALWSCPEDNFSLFPMEFALDFFRNHKMLQIKGRPIWKVVEGGSRTYVDKLLKDIGDRIHLNTPIRAVERTPKDVRVDTESSSKNFDEVIFACHADQALELLTNPSSCEATALKCFPYEENEVTLHTDDSLMPKRKSAWASWNARTNGRSAEKSTVTYNMNILQGINDPTQFCVSLNQNSQVESTRIIEKINFSHPMFARNRKKVQANHEEFIRRDRISFCGAYWGYGFHEDGLQSGLRVCEAYGETLT